MAMSKLLLAPLWPTLFACALVLSEEFQLVVMIELFFLRGNGAP